MPPRLKKCKGLHKDTYGLGCGKSVPQKSRTYGLCKECYKDWLINTPEGHEKIKRASMLAAAPRLRLEMAKKEHWLDQKYSKRLIYARNRVHAYVRSRDKGKPCISCGAPWNPDFQAGHFFKAELYTNVKFDLENIHGQCVKCNIRLDGNPNGYAKFLPHRIGKEQFDKLKMRASKNPYTFSDEELEHIIQQVKDLRAEMKRKDKLK